MFKITFSAGRKILLLGAVCFTATVIWLGLTPNYTCGCGEIENGTKLTYVINQISKSVVGKPVFKANKTDGNPR